MDKTVLKTVAAFLLGILLVVFAVHYGIQAERAEKARVAENERYDRYVTGMYELELNNMVESLGKHSSLQLTDEQRKEALEKAYKKIDTTIWYKR